MSTNQFTIWMAQIRANFLLLAVLLVLIGLAAALQFPGLRVFAWWEVAILFLGVVASHISVNLFNEYSDFRTKIDFNTNRTPFSGGTGMLTAGLTTPHQVLAVAYATLFLSILIGVYFSLTSHWTIFIIALIGAFSVVAYTKLLSKFALGEFFSGLALGSLVVIGSYIALTATPGVSVSQLVPSEVVWLSIPPGILTFLLLFINQLPDVEADKTGGRRHLVILMGRKAAARFYVGGLILSFAIVAILPLVGLASPWILIALLPLPIATKASLIAIKEYGNTEKLIPALVNNVITVLSVDLLLAIGTFIG
jgi:1,4-dihydroxy-2-naphthoate octaprenyltransferase